MVSFVFDASKQEQAPPDSGNTNTNKFTISISPQTTPEVDVALKPSWDGTTATPVVKHIASSYTPEFITEDDLRDIIVTPAEPDHMLATPVVVKPVLEDLGEVIGKFASVMFNAVAANFSEFVTLEDFLKLNEEILYDAEFNGGARFAELNNQYKRLVGRADLQWRTFCKERAAFQELYNFISGELNGIYSVAKSATPHKLLKQALSPAPGGTSGDRPRIKVTPYLAQQLGIKAARSESKKVRNVPAVKSEPLPQAVDAAIKPEDFENENELELARMLGAIS